MNQKRDRRLGHGGGVSSTTNIKSVSFGSGKLVGGSEGLRLSRGTVRGAKKGVGSD